MQTVMIGVVLCSADRSLSGSVAVSVGICAMKAVTGCALYEEDTLQRVTGLPMP